MDYLKEIESAKDLDALENLRVHLLGKSGIITLEFKGLKDLNDEDKKTEGAKLNIRRDEIQNAILAKKNELHQLEVAQKIQTEALDVTLPPRTKTKGNLHILTHVLNQIEGYFRSLGFSVYEGPEIEDTFHNFDALNIPKHHPARQNHDTFFMKDNPEMLLRTHTSTVQIRTLQNKKPPLRIMSKGRVYRADDLDATHTPMFHQVEILVVEPSIHMGHLKGCLEDFLKYFFEISDVKMRLRPSFFPFTEPSAEVDIYNVQQDRWLEVLGSGMVHPNVLENCGIDSKENRGFAFGMGIERLTMLKYGIKDIRDLYTNDLRFLEGFGGVL